MIPGLAVSYKWRKHPVKTVKLVRVFISYLDTNLPTSIMWWSTMGGLWNLLGLGLNIGIDIYELCGVRHVLNHSTCFFIQVKRVIRVRVRWLGFLSGSLIGLQSDTSYDFIKPIYLQVKMKVLVVLNRTLFPPIPGSSGNMWGGFFVV